MLYLKSLALWLVFLVVAVGLALVRDLWLSPAFGSFRAHQMGTLAVCGLISIVVLFGVRWLKLQPAQGLQVGSFWVTLTLLFEFGVFGVLLGYPWSELLADYNVLKGRLWPLVLLTELLSPCAFARYAA
jgi:hypothetical protein